MLMVDCNETPDTRRPSNDDGFALIEVIVAFVVLALFSSVLVVTLLNGLQVSKHARQRVAAANLAAREIEIVRNQFATSGDSALAVAATASVTNQNSLTGAVGTPSVVDGVPYTIVRTAQWYPTGTGETACDGGGSVNFPALKVSVQVTWPNMGTAKPVHSETSMTPLKGQLDDDALMFVAIGLQNAAGGKVTSGIPVTVSGPGGTFTKTSDASGCAVFQVNTAGTYTVKLNSPGWVDQTGVQASTKVPSVAVTAGSLGLGTMTYDVAAGLDVTVAAPAGYLLPSPLPLVNYTQPNVNASVARRTVASAGVTTRVSSLWPTTAGYSPWLGGCPDSDPLTAPTSGTRISPVSPNPGQVLPATVTLAPVDITAKTTAGALIPNGIVTAVNQSGCTTADSTLTLGTTSSTGTLKASLPFGVWKLSIKVGATTFPAQNSTPLQPASTGATTYNLRTV
jgi:type II secretory pathway pseudopilin PulG